MLELESSQVKWSEVELWKSDVDLSRVKYSHGRVM